MVNDLDFEIRLIGKNGDYVDIHAKSDANKRQEHIEAAQILADKGHCVLLMPEIIFGMSKTGCSFFLN